MRGQHFLLLPLREKRLPPQNKKYRCAIVANLADLRKRGFISEPTTEAATLALDHFRNVAEASE
jgi:hypothetical protein